MGVSTIEEATRIMKNLTKDNQIYMLTLARVASKAEESVRKNLDSSKQKATS